MNDGRLQTLHQCLSSDLDKIRNYFNRPEECKVTLIVRTPWLKKGDVVVSNDTDEEAIAAIQRLAKAKDAHCTPAKI